MQMFGMAGVIIYRAHCHLSLACPDLTMVQDEKSKDQ